jgi:L-ribulose-5-phosphate 3-epimerase
MNTLPHSPRVLSRRALLASAARSAAALAVASPFAPLFAASGARRFKIGACDWSLGKHSDPEALTVAKQLGLDGVQVSLGTAANDMHLRQAAMQQTYRDAAKQKGVAVASLAIGELNNIPYKREPRTIEWVRDSIDVARAMGVRVVLLAFFGENDLKGDAAGTTAVVERLKEIAPKAEKAKVILGIESWLSATELLDILTRVGSKSVQVYYDVCNSNDRGYDIYNEIRRLGRDRICEFHFKENGKLLGKGRVDYTRVRAALDQIDYRGWVQIEGAVPTGSTMLESYPENVKFARGVLG